MNRVKKTFSIKDLENLSGVKAHTIRIWEKRYGLLAPERTKTNIRLYSLSSLQKLLNIALLNENGVKISKIAKIPESEIAEHVNQITEHNRIKLKPLNAFKMAMVNFDEKLFIDTYNELKNSESFENVITDVFFPFLTELGLLWQTDSINPAHEHFITHLIKQKIILETESLQTITPSKNDKVFVLFLPENEIHEIGLLYLNYEVVRRGYKSIYLGQAVPLSILTNLKAHYSNLIFVSYFTVSPTKDQIENYVNDFETTVNTNGTFELWLLGQQTQYLGKQKLPKHIKTFTSIEELTKKMA